ncbi:fibronectin type III domain-containing protein [Desulfobacterales bacterium]|nr:fibronectin type III domain-containing protein [Desulfobacterales bacterium]
MKIAYIFFLSVFGLFTLFVSIGSADNYTFSWDPPRQNDNVVEYKIYYRMNANTYNETDFEAVEITNQNFDVTNPVWKINLPHVDEEYCFTATAINANGLESRPSKEIGYGKSCGKTAGDGGGGGGGGGCFIWETKTK